LLPDSNLAAADVDVRVAQRVYDLGHRNAVGFQLVRVDLDSKFFGWSSPTVDGRNARDSQQSARNDPILNRTQIGDSKVWRTNDLITIDFSRRAVRLDTRCLIAR
jgi:hypothetical protein